MQLLKFTGFQECMTVLLFFYFSTDPHKLTRSVFSVIVDTIIFAVRSNTFMCDTLELSTLYCLPDMQIRASQVLTLVFYSIRASCFENGGGGHAFDLSWYIVRSMVGAIMITLCQEKNAPSIKN
jgi:hypothetical protein